MARDRRDVESEDARLIRDALSDLGVDITSPDGASVFRWLEDLLDETQSIREELESACNRYAELFDMSPLPYVRLNAHGVIVELNLAASRLLGKPRPFATGTPILFYVTPSERRGFLEYLRRCRSAGGNVTLEVHLTGRNGHHIPVEMVSTRVENGEGKAFLYTAIFDRTEREESERVLAASQKRLAAAVEAAAVGIVEYDVPIENGYECDERLATVLGFRRGELPPPRRVRDWFQSRIHSMDRERVEKAYEDFVEGRTVAYTCEARFRHEERRWVYLRIWAAATKRDTKGRARHVVGAVMDVSEAKHRERELERKTQQLREMAARIFSIEERERRQIASELEGNLGQLLGLIEMKLDVLRRSGNSGGVVHALGDVIAHVAEASEVVGSLSAQASPPVLRELGLGPALGRLVRDMEQDHDLQIFLETPHGLPPLDPDRGVAVCRAVQELLTNVSRHARTDKARVVMSYEPETATLSLSVEDDGVGFDAEQAHKRNMAGARFGLLQVEERIASLGGSFELDSIPGRGTRVRFRLPVEPQAAASGERSQEGLMSMDVAKKKAEASS